MLATRARRRVRGERTNMTRELETSIDISASPQQVWAALTDFSSLEAWSRFILAIDGELRPGAQLTVRLDDGGGPMTIRPRLLVASPQEELRWQGKLGARWVFVGEHYFRVRALADGRTRFIHGEQFDGLLVPLLWRRLDTRTRAGFTAFNEALRARAEAM
jgi:hypothetical protein